MYYILIYKKISELLFQISNASYFFPFIDCRVRHVNMMDSVQAFTRTEMQTQNMMQTCN